MTIVTSRYDWMTYQWSRYTKYITLYTHTFGVVHVCFHQKCVLVHVLSRDHCQGKQQQNDNLISSQGFEAIYDSVAHYGVASQSVVLECQQGSQIWVESEDTDCNVFGNSAAHGYSNFGGYIVGAL